MRFPRSTRTRPRQVGGSIEAFEMRPAMEAGGPASNTATALTTGNDHEKAGNERDRMDMHRVGKDQELKVRRDQDCWTLATHRLT